eukprot:UN12522
MDSQLSLEKLMSWLAYIDFSSACTETSYLVELVDEIPRRTTNSR